MDHMSRIAKIERNTKETKITCSLNLDGSGICNADTGIGFLDHMLEGFSKHGFFDLDLKIMGDLQVDGHHTVEDCGIVLGLAIKEALGDKSQIKRYGSSTIPMDDVLMLTALDLSGRPYFVYDVKLNTEKVGYLETQLVKEFFYAISYSAGMNLHMKLFHGENDHHIIESLFKSFARALSEAVSKDARIKDVLSTKGSL